MRLGPLNHVGLVVPSIARACDFYELTVGAGGIGALIEPEGLALRFCFVKTPSILLELIEPLDTNTAIAAFLRQHPGGAQHHLCYEVSDLLAARQWFEEKGSTLAGPITWGVQGFPIFFVNAENLGGTLLEIMERPPRAASAQAVDWPLSMTGESRTSV